MTEKRAPRVGFSLTSVGFATVFFALLQGLALMQTGGVFEYPLDDVYIHLAMAENIGHGGYGVNPGEYASAASSALYPLLLLPVVPPELQRFLPLIWNFIGLSLSAWLWAQMLLSAGYDKDGLRPVGLILAALGPLAYLSVSTAFVGMEHTLHGAASLAILLGLFRYLKGEPGIALLFVGVLFSPLLRFEGLALAVLAVGVLFATGNRKAAGIALGLSLIPLALFVGFLVAVGLDPLPSSVLTKIADAGGDGVNLVQRLGGRLRQNLGTAGGAAIAAFAAGIWIMIAVSREVRLEPMRYFAGTVILAALAHLMLGQIGWLNRYEHYILLVVSTGFVALLPIAMSGRSNMVTSALAVLPMLGLMMIYIPETLRLFPVSARAIHTQQGQMATLVKDYVKAPIAVNDLGWVSWNNPEYVLDLWGLASSEARILRLDDGAPGWAGPLAEKNNVVLAMIYDERLQEAAGTEWVRLGWFVLKERRGFLGSERVAFYATKPEYVPELVAAIKDWEQDLHPLTHYEYAVGVE